MSVSMCSTAIILAGGLGTRLRSVVPDLPKCMAPIHGQPFLHYVIAHLKAQGIVHFVFALGYKHEYFLDYLERTFPEGNYTLSMEEAPLGTGGAIRQACSLINEENVLVTNGDTLFKGDIPSLLRVHEQSKADCSLLLKPMQQFSRYGVVELSPDGLITSFKEKQYYESGLINAGMYLLRTRRFLSEALPEKFSFEKDYLEAFYRSRIMCGVPQDAYFIDIGIPADYARAQAELS
ncbi:nucleotidyltransferase family protein [Filimonas effusa]|uniref:Nucleotidyltransferase n=1 Tax=Filimonas effusa TaxID=2508721 RepID=A0A4Q1DA35_9BACT|nr:nucleotidyltransferase family protein [Filimonas effusa]RXK86231.1 nucleotidyltransferase [Filimonas effusa]